MNTIQEQWEQFESLVINPNAPDVQRSEMKRAFYAGAQALLNVEWAIADTSLSDDAVVEMLEGCYQEIQMFADQVKQGKA